MQPLSDNGEVSVELDELMSSPVPQTPTRPLALHSRYTARPVVNVLLDVMYDSDSSPSRSQSQVGGGRRRASSIPPGDYTTPTRLRTTLFPTPRAAGSMQDAVARRAQLVTPANPPTQKKALPHPPGPRAPSHPPRSCSGSFQPQLTTYAGNKSHRTARNSDLQPSPQSEVIDGTHGAGPLMSSDELHGIRSSSPVGTLNEVGADLLFAADYSLHPDDYFSIPPLNDEHSSAAQHAQFPTTTITPAIPEIPATPHSSQPEHSPPLSGPDSDIEISDDVLSRKGGRISKANHEILEEAFGVIDEMFARLADETGFSEDRVVNLWNKHSGRGTRGYNPWNVYESYLSTNLVEELEHAGFDVPRDIKWEDITHAQRQICYEKFQEHYPGDLWEEILHVYDLSRKCEPTGGTFSKRSAIFHKISSQLVRLTDMWQAKHNFEFAWAMCGNVPNEDASLAMSHETTNAKKASSNDEVRAHMKVHVYDRVSRSAIAQAWGDEIVDEGIATSEKTSKMSRMDQQTKSALPSVGYKSRGSTQDVSNLKQQIVDRAREAGFIIDSSLFPWKGLRDLLAKLGYYLMGWPWESRMPGEKGTEKGISGLRAQEQTAVFAALANTDYPLRFVRYEGNLRDLTDSRVPVILGAPSETARGRRLFVNGNIDDKGVRHTGATQPNKASSRIPSKSSHPVDTFEPSHPTTSHLRSRSSTNPAKRPLSKRSRSRKRTVAQVVSSGDDSTGEDSESPPQPKRARSAIAKAIPASKQRQRSHVTVPSSESDDDQPLTTMRKATAQVSRAHSKTVTFASLDDEDNMSTYEDSSDIGHGSPSPPQTRMKTQRREREMAKVKTKGLPEDLPGPSDHTAGGSGGSRGGSTLRSAGGFVASQARGVSATSLTEEPGGSEHDGSSGRAAQMRSAKGLTINTGGSNDVSRGSQSLYGASRASKSLTEASRGPGGHSINGSAGASGGSEVASVAAPTGLYPTPKPTHQGASKKPRGDDNIHGANLLVNPSATNEDNMHPPPGPITGVALPTIPTTALVGQALPPAPPIGLVHVHDTSGAAQSLPHGPLLHQTGGGAGPTAGEMAAVPLDEGPGALNPNPMYGYPPGNMSMYYPPYPPGALPTGGSSTGQALPYPYPFYPPFAMPGARQGQPYWQPHPQGLLPPYGQFTPPGQYPLIPQILTNEDNAGGVPADPSAQNPPTDILEQRQLGPM